jgi:hypothetical protein
MVMKSTSASRVQKHRNSLRASGLRPIQLWVPDTRKKSFATTCKKQSLKLKNDSQERNILKQISSVFDKSGWV